MQTPRLRQVFYISRRADGVSDLDVRQILAESRRRNQTRDITGSLTFSDRHFAQFVEGRPDDVAALIGVIAGDRRHTDVRVLLDRPATLRAFGQWSMAFLYSLELGDEVERLFHREGPADEATIEVIFRLTPDSLMGAL